MIAVAGMTPMALVTLSVAGQLCGIPVSDVRDILSARPITRIPLAPPEIAGNLNLRGRIVTALDIRRRLDLPAAPPGAALMSLVTEYQGELYAMLVDCVLEVITLPGETLEAIPSTLPRTWAKHGAGIFQLPDRLLVMLDVTRLLDLAH